MALTDMWHSRHYHRYFEGYVEVKVPKPGGGGMQIDRIYVEDYFTQDLSDRAWIAGKVLRAALFALSLAVYLYSASRPVFSNTTPYVAFPGFLIVVVMFALLMTLFGCCTAPRLMTIWEHYSTARRLRRYSLAAAGLLVLNALTVGGLLLFGAGESSGDLPVMAGYFAAALVMLAINRIEARTPYKKVPNKEMPPRHS